VILVILVFAVSSAGATETQVVELVKSPLDNTLRMKWNVEVYEDGGLFVIYRGDGLTDLIPIAAIKGAASGQFEYVDDGPRPSRSVYQLRYKDRSGRELVLATVLVRPDGLQDPTDAVSLSTTSLAGILPEVAVIGGGGGVAVVPNPPSRLTDGCNKPPTPPPRSS
jgi:hypothetical protein